MSVSILLVFVVWLNYQIKKTTKLSNKSRDEFWKKESLANQKRPEDISGLDYINIPIDKLPMDDLSDDTINSYRDTIFSLFNKKILNLSSFSNTELKLKYGVSNLKILSEYDDNYTKLVSFLQKWGERLYTQGYLNEAQAVLEVAIDCKTDVRKTYLLLAKIYAKQSSPEKILALIDKVTLSNIQDKEDLSSKLKEYISPDKS
ncbi:MAG: hypothetical protein GX237_00070 [Clostridiales bacterium]|nr:hypothetical protein [Clostridiales bacterium]